jgi:hypothetical protein
MAVVRRKKNLSSIGSVEDDSGSSLELKALAAIVEQKNYVCAKKISYDRSKQTEISLRREARDLQATCGASQPIKYHKAENRLPSNRIYAIGDLNLHLVHEVDKVRRSMERIML